MHNDQNSYIANTDSDTEQKKVQTDKWTDRKKNQKSPKVKPITLQPNESSTHTYTHTNLQASRFAPSIPRQ